MEILSKFITSTKIFYNYYPFSLVVNVKTPIGNCLLVCDIAQHSSYIDYSSYLYKIDFLDGKIHQLQYYDPDGSLQGSFKMTENVHVYIHKIYHQNRLLIEHKCNSRNSGHCKISGLERSYYPNGKLHTKSNYYNGKLQGAFIVYHANGAIKCRGEYYNNRTKRSSVFKYGNDYKTITPICYLCSSVCSAMNCSIPSNRECALMHCVSDHMPMSNTSITLKSLVVSCINMGLNGKLA